MARAIGGNKDIRFMKKSIRNYGIAGLIVLAGICASAFAPAPPASGGCTPGGTYYTVSTASPVYSGKLDSITNTGTDTFKLALGCKPTSITFSNSILKVSGTPTVTVAMYASCDGGATYITTPITTYTVSPTSLTVPVVNGYLVNSAYGGNPYTNYMWVATGSATSAVSWQGKVLIR